jgi:hypothetical protein
LEIEAIKPSLLYIPGGIGALYRALEVVVAVATAEVVVVATTMVMLELIMEGVEEVGVTTAATTAMAASGVGSKTFLTTMADNLGPAIVTTIMPCISLFLERSQTKTNAQKLKSGLF